MAAPPVPIDGVVETLRARALTIPVSSLAAAALVPSFTQARGERVHEALDMMARSLRAGHSLASAFKMVATELPAPINIEFGRAFEEQNLGMSFERAVIQMTKRAPQNRELKIFAVSVILQKETGGNLVEIAEGLAELVRQRYRFYGKLKTLTAEGR